MNVPGVGSPASRAPVAVVIVSWNSAAYLPGCLDSLRRLVRPPAEIVVVDGGSSDDSVGIVQRSYPEARLIACPDNIGFCAGNNRGIRATSSPFVLALNPDTVLEPGFLETLLALFEDPRVGIAAGKLLRFDGVTLDSAGQELSRSRRPRDRGYGRADRGQFDRDEPVFGACGAAALYRRAMLDSIADPGACYFDENFFAFGEDLDLAWRARRVGWTAVYGHAARARHARGASSPAPRWLMRWSALASRGTEIRFHVAKNRYLTILRNETVAGYLKDFPFIAARDLAVLGLLVLTSPGVLVRLWHHRALFHEARRRGRLDGARVRVHVEQRRA